MQLTLRTELHGFPSISIDLVCFFGISCQLISSSFVQIVLLHISCLIVRYDQDG